MLEVQHLLVCVVEAHIWSKYCMQINCTSKQKRQREAVQLVESKFLGLSILALPDVLNYTVHWCFE